MSTSPSLIVPKLGSFNVPLRLSPLQIDTSVCPPGSLNNSNDWILEPQSGYCLPGTSGAFGLWAIFTRINPFGGFYPGSRNNCIPRQFIHWYLDETGIFSVSSLLKNPQQYGNYGNYQSTGCAIHGPGTIHFASTDNNAYMFYNENISTAYCDIIQLKHKISKISNALFPHSNPYNLYTIFSNAFILVDDFGNPQFLPTNINSGAGDNVCGWYSNVEPPQIFQPGEFGTDGENVFPIIRIGPEKQAYATFGLGFHLAVLEKVIIDPYSANCIFTNDNSTSWMAMNLRIPWGESGGLGPTSPQIPINLADDVDNADFQSSLTRNSGSHFAIPGGGYGVHSYTLLKIYLIDALFRGYYVYNVQPLNSAINPFNSQTGMDWHGNIWANAASTEQPPDTLYSSIGTHQTSPLKLFGNGALNFNSQVAFSECIPDLRRKRLW